MTTCIVGPSAAASDADPQVDWIQGFGKRYSWS